MENTTKKNGKLGGILIIVAIVIITIGAIVGYTIYNNNKKAEAEAKAKVEAQTNAFKEYNDKINAIVTPLNVADANGQNPSIENNNDVNALQTAITSLQGLEKEVTDNTILTEEQKNTLKGTITNNITGIQNRINAINQAQAEAQAKAEQEAREQAEAQARAEASKSSSSTSNNKSRANNGGSSSSGRSSSSGGSSNSGGSSAPADSGNSGGDAPSGDSNIIYGHRNEDGTMGNRDRAAAAEYARQISEKIARGEPV